MNRRQKKKQFKKRYGYNPPKTKIAIGGDWAAVEESVTKIAIWVQNVIIPRIAQTINEAVQYANNAIERIKEMPEEKWQEAKKKLSPRQIILGEEIRGNCTGATSYIINYAPEIQMMEERDNGND